MSTDKPLAADVRPRTDGCKGAAAPLQIPRNNAVAHRSDA